MEIEILSHHIIWYALFTLIGGAVGIFSYRQSFPPLDKLWKIGLSALRAAMVILIGVFLIEPLINLYSSRTITPQLAVIFDTSKSMSIKENDHTRLSEADGLARAALSGLKANYKYFDFATNLNDADGIPSESNLTGDATSIANALQDFGSRKDFDNYGAIALITDGRQNLGEDPLRAATKLNIPIYTLTVGEEVAEKNLAIENVIYPAVVYSGDTLKIDGEISGNGIAPGKSRAFLKLGPTVIADAPFDIPQENRKIKVNFTIKAPDPGNYEYTLSTPILEGESNKVDNERLFAIRVLKNKIKVFVGTVELNWEFKFVKQSLERFPEIAVDAVYPESPGNFVDPGIPHGVDGLKKYDVVILIDCAPSRIRIQNADLKKYLNDGGSLVYVTGNNAVKDIHFFEDMLPLKIDNPKVVAGEFLFEPSPERKQHAAILIGDDPDQSVRTWRSLPPFDDVLSGVTPTGDVLLEALQNAQPGSAKSDKSNYPILTVGAYGKGHVAAITGYAWWKSYFSSVADARIANAIPEFWHNLTKWASATDQMKNFHVITDRKVYRLGEPVRLTGYLYDEANRPRSGAYVSVSLSPQSESTAVKDAILPPVDNGIYSEEASSLAPGEYKFNATATSYGDILGKTTGEFTIENFSLEMTSSAPDYNLTRRISEATGGIAYDKSDFNKFPSQLKLTPYVKEDQASVKPFGMPILLIILLAGLCLEWGLRKKFRLP